MNSIKVLNKWLARAKNIQDCHYDAAANLRFLHYATGIPLVIISAIAASNILAEADIFVLFEPYSPFTASFISLLVTVLAAIQAFSGFEKRSDLHYKSGVKYGSIKREIEIMTNVDEKKLSELNAKWNALTDESPPIPLGVWKRNEKKSNKQSPTAPTHAGGVVIRKEGDTFQYLIVQTKKEPRKWVFPKGHINRGESMEQAARREVLEETGVKTAVRDMLDTVEFSAPNGRVKAQFFLMEVVKEGLPQEGRERQWMNFDEAMQTLRFKEAKSLVLKAETMLRHSERGGI